MFREQKTPDQQLMWIEASELARTPVNTFYSKLDEVLESHGLFEKIREICERHYHTESRVGRPGTDPVVYFRMLLIGWIIRDEVSLEVMKLGASIAELKKDWNTGSMPELLNHLTPPMVNMFRVKLGMSPIPHSMVSWGDNVHDNLYLTRGWNWWRQRSNE